MAGEKDQTSPPPVVKKRKSSAAVSQDVASTCIPSVPHASTISEPSISARNVSFAHHLFRTTCSAAPSYFSEEGCISLWDLHDIYHVEVQMHGVDSDKFKVEVNLESRMLTITAWRSDDIVAHDVKAMNKPLCPSKYTRAETLSAERQCKLETISGSATIQRRIVLPEDADLEKISASLEDQYLHIDIVKRKQTGIREIKVTLLN